MKLIKNFRSPNYDLRRNKEISFIIIHYTALENCKKAISYLCDPINKVSCHFLISQTGSIYKLVNENKRAWHAGVSFWNGYKDINSLSIGIELDFSDNKNNNTYSKKMIGSLINLIIYLKNKYNIENRNILGHSEISPYRKQDPGPKFPWKVLDNKNISCKINTQFNLKKIKLKKWFLKNNIRSRIQITKFILSIIGYNTLDLKNKKNSMTKLISVYQARYMINYSPGKIDNCTVNFLFNHLLNILLTKK